MKKISDIIMNPIRMRIIQLVILRKQITTQGLLNELPDIPRASLYRHVKELVDANVLLVVDEHKVRGQIERTYSTNQAWWNEENKLENADMNFYQLLMGLYSKCHTYFSNESADPQADKIFFSHMILMLTDSEMDLFVSDMKELFNRYTFPFSKNRKIRDFTLISSPNTDIKENYSSTQQNLKGDKK